MHRGPDYGLRAAEVAVSEKTTCDEKKNTPYNAVWRVALMWPKWGNQDNRAHVYRGVMSDRGRADRHLVNAERCPCYGQMHSTGCCTDRQTVQS